MYQMNSMLKTSPNTFRTSRKNKTVVKIINIFLLKIIKQLGNTYINYTCVKKYVIEFNLKINTPNYVVYTYYLLISLMLDVAV